jgi:hypothetical protein
VRDQKLRHGQLVGNSIDLFMTAFAKGRLSAMQSVLNNP